MHAKSDGVKPCLLITGASGLLGHPLVRLARPTWSVVAVYRRHRPVAESVTCVQADLTDAVQQDALFERFQPRAVIHAAANARVADCQADPDAAEQINVAVPARLAEKCAHLAIDFLFTSTDLVFDGRQAPYGETAVPRPLGVYAEQKARAERAVCRHHADALVCRMPLLFGLAPHAGDHFTVQMLAALAEDRPLNLFVDEFRTPVDSASAARGLLTVLGRARGVLHMGGRSRVSRYDLGLLMADAVGVAPTMIRAVAIDTLKLAAPRSPDCSLDSRRAFALGYAPTPLEKAVQETVQLYLQQRACAK